MSCILLGTGIYREVAVGRASLGSIPVLPHRLCALNFLNLSFFMESGILVRFAEMNHGSPKFNTWCLINIGKILQHFCASVFSST